LGWEIYDNMSIPKFNKYNYIISIDNSSTVEIYCHSNHPYWNISARKEGNLVYVESASTLEIFVERLKEVASAFNINFDIEKPRTSIRINKSEPASNKVKLVDLINGRSIKKIFDPYFDNKSIKLLLSLSHLGLKLNNDLQCLTSLRMKKSIDSIFVNDFNSELSVNMGIKLLSSNNEHRRFMILDDDSVIILGCSLNDINKNEAAHEEKSQVDIVFFNEGWQNGKRL